MRNRETPNKKNIFNNINRKAYPSFGSIRLFFIFTIILFILQPVQNTKAWQAKYYKNRASQYPKQFYYHKRYIQILLKKKMKTETLNYIESLKKKHFHIYNLLFGYYNAALGKIKTAKLIWRKSWTIKRYYINLISMYGEFNLKKEIIPMLENKYKKKPSLSIGWLLYNYLKIYHQKKKLFDLLLDMAFKYKSKLMIIKKRFLLNISGHKDSLLAENSINLIISKKKLRNSRLIKELHILIQIKNRNYQKALRISRELIRQDPSRKDFIIDIIKSLRNNHSTALKFFKIISHLKLGNKHMYILASLYMKTNIKKTVNILKRIIKSGYEYDRAFRLLYQSLAGLKKYKESLYYLNRISRKLTEDYKNAGIYHMIMKRINLAYFNFSRLKGPLKSIYTSLLYIYRGNKKEAQKILQNFIKKRPYSKTNSTIIDLLFFLKDANIKNTKILSSIIISYLKKDFYNAGKAVLKINKPLSDFWKSRALLLISRFYQNSAKFHEAVKILDRIINSNIPLKDRAIFKKANIFKYKLKKIKAANELFFNLIAKFPNSIYLYKARRELLKTE